MGRWITIILLAIGVVSTSFWGYKEHEDKNAVLIQAENTYQRSFHELSYNMDLLNDKIGTVLAMNSKERLSPQLVEIWRLASEALSNVGQLPLTLLPFNKTEEFLSNIGDFTYQTAVRDLNEDPLSDKEIQTLETLYEQSEDVKNDLREVQHDILENDLRWMDVQLALATDDEQEDNTVIDGLKTVEKKVEGYSEENTDSSLIGTEEGEDENQYQYLQNKKRINENEALTLSQSIINVDDEQKLDITKSGDGAQVPFYSISYQDGDKNTHVDVSQNGGYPLSMLVDRTVNEQTLSLNDGQQEAEKYIKELHFNDMTLFRSSQYDTVGVYSFLQEQNSVRIYPDTIEVKVALDDGEIIGLSSENYFLNHHDRELAKPKISKKEARTKVNPNVDIKEEHLAVIANELEKEVLTYEFLGTMNGDTYRIFINASDGTEEQVERLKRTSNI